MKRFKFSDDTSSIKTLLESPLIYTADLDITQSTIIDGSGNEVAHTSSTICLEGRNWFSVTDTPLIDTTGSSGYGSEGYYYKDNATTKQESFKRTCSLPCLVCQDKQPNTRSSGSLSITCKCPFSSSQSSFCYKCHSPIKTSVQQKSLYQDDKGYFRFSLNQQN